MTTRPRHGPGTASVSLFDRLNRRLLARLGRNVPRLSVEEGAVRLSVPGGEERRLPFATLKRATLLHRDVYAADAILLRLVFRGGKQVEIYQDDPRWNALVAALDRSGRIGVPSASWQLQAIADGPGAPPRDLIDP